MNARDANRPLTAKVEGQELVIRIGVNTMACAVAYSNWANEYSEPLDGYFRSFAITDPAQFAKDAALAMQHEREDGSSSLTDLINKACEDAVEDGSIACEHSQAIKYGEKAAIEPWCLPYPSDKETQ